MNEDTFLPAPEDHIVLTACELCGALFTQDIATHYIECADCAEFEPLDFDDWDI